MNRIFKSVFLLSVPLMGVAAPVTSDETAVPVVIHGIVRDDGKCAVGGLVHEGTADSLFAGLSAYVGGKPQQIEGESWTDPVSGIVWTYSLDASGDATLLGVSQSGRTLIVPETLDGHDVTAIGSKAFVGLGAETVIVPENIESVGANAFANCRSLAQVDFEGEPPTGLGAAGFPATTLVRYNDAYEESWAKALAEAGLTNVSIYHPLMDLDWEYEYCDGGVRITGLRNLWHHDYELGEVRIPSSLWWKPVIEVGGGRGGFSEYDNDFITAITIPDGVQTIGDMAFDSCGLLTTARIPESVTRIGMQAFSECTNLTNITLPKRLQTIDMNAFFDCSSLLEISIPASVTNIGNAAFYHCMKLASIEVEDGNPSYVSIGGVLYDKDVRTLIQCPALVSSVEIPETVKIIRPSAFFWCSKIGSLHIPASVEEIGRFVGCDSLTELTVDSKSKRFSARDGVLYDYGEKTLVCCLPTCKAMDVPQTVVRIDWGGFICCSNLVKIVLPANLREIGEDAFEECRSLKSITIPSGVRNIPDMAFYMCRNLKEIQLLGAVTNIGRDAFHSCRSLESVTLPASVKHIGEGAFASCSDLELTFKGTPPQVDGGWSEWSGPFSGCTCGYYSAFREEWEAEIDVDGKWHGLRMAYADKAESTLVTFAQPAASAEKAGAFRLVVYGGSDEGATSVKVAVAYGNAKAADLVLKNAAVSGADGVEKTNLKFPLTLTWAAGDTEPKTIVVPVAAGKATDAPKFLAWNLTDAKGCRAGGQACCIGTIAAGEEWSGEDVCVLPYVADAAGGKVSGGTGVKPDKKGAYKQVTLKATPNKGYWFAGWCGADGEWASGDLSFKVTPDGESGPLSKYEARFVKAKPTLCATYDGYARVNLKGMTLAKNADTSNDVYGKYPFSVTLSSAGKLSGSVTVGGKKVSFKSDGCFETCEYEAAGEGWIRFRFPVEEKAWFGRGNVEMLQLEISRKSSRGEFSEYGVARLGGFSFNGDFAPLGDEESGLAYRNVDKSDVKLLAPFVGTYAVALDYGDEGVIPLSVSVDKNGKVKASGMYSDGTKLTMRGTFSYRGISGEAIEMTTGETTPIARATANLFASPSALGKGSLHVELRIGHYVNWGRSDAYAGGARTQYAASAVKTTVELDSRASLFTSGCWFPKVADPDFGVVRLTTGEDVIDILYASKNGQITGLGKALQPGFTVKFDTKTGLLTVTKGKEYTIQGVLANHERYCYLVGRINKDGTCEPVDIDFETLPTPEERFPWTDDGFELTLGRVFDEGMQPSVESEDGPLALTVTGLPAGLKYDKKTGLITGAPTKAGEFKVKVGYSYGTRKVTRETTLVVLPKPEGLPIGTYAGSATVYVDGTNGEQRVDCPFTATIDKNGALSGSITLFGKKATFKASGYECGWEGWSAYTATLDLKAIDKTWGTASLRIWASEEDMTEESLGSGLFGDGYTIGDVTACRNQSKDPGYAARVAPYAGTYVSALETEFFADSGEWFVTTLSVAVDKRGVAKLAGKFADGTAFSASSQLSLFVDEEDSWAYADVVVLPKSLAQGGMKISLEFSNLMDEETKEWHVSLWSDAEAAKYVRSSGEFASSYMSCGFSYRYTPLAWVNPSEDPRETCLSVSSDNDSFEEVTFAWTTKTVAGEKVISGVGRRLSGPAMTFRIDEKTGLFSGTCGKYKIFGAMEEGACSGYGTAVGKDGSIDRVTVGVAWRW